MPGLAAHRASILAFSSGALAWIAAVFAHGTCGMIGTRPAAITALAIETRLLQALLIEAASPGTVLMSLVPRLSVT